METVTNVMIKTVLNAMEMLILAKYVILGMEYRMDTVTNVMIKTVLNVMEILIPVKSAN